MAKIYVTDKTGKNPVPFLRGILTRSLNEAGLAFGQAYKVASDIRDRLSNNDSVTNHGLRALVSAHLSEHFPEAIANAYRMQSTPAAGVQVRNSAHVVLPFSRTEHLRCLAACGLSQEQAARASTMILAQLSAQQRWEVSTDELRAFTRKCLAQHFGDRVAERYRVWMQFNQSGRPLILLIGGTSGSGKSTVATSLAHRLGIVRTQSSDMLREAPSRGAKSQLANFDRVWQLQAFLLSEADRTGTPILINDDNDKVTDLILGNIIDALADSEQRQAA